MRKINIVTISLCWLLCISVQGATGDKERVLDLKLQNSTGRYAIAVTSGVAEQSLTISLEEPETSVPVGHYSGVGFVYGIPTYPEKDRLITLWESGVSLTLVIFRLAPPSKQPEIVFNDNSEIRPDFINSPSGDFLLLYSGKRFKGGTAEWFPESATIYKWEGARYRKLKTVPYAQRFTYFSESRPGTGW